MPSIPSAEATPTMLIRGDLPVTSDPHVHLRVGPAAAFDGSRWWVPIVLEVRTKTAARRHRFNAQSFPDAVQATLDEIHDERPATVVLHDRDRFFDYFGESTIQQTEYQLAAAARQVTATFIVRTVSTPRASDTERYDVVINRWPGGTPRGVRSDRPRHPYSNSDDTAAAGSTTDH